MESPYESRIGVASHRSNLNDHDQWLRIKSQLATLNHTLEQQVRDRTSSLESVNHTLSRQILERDQIGHCLQQSEDRLNLVIQGSNEGIWEWDFISQTAYFSDRFKELLGYEIHEFESSPSAFHQHIHHQNMPEVNRAFQRHLNGEGPYDLKIRIKMKSGEPSQMAGSLLDISHEQWLIQRQATQYAVSKVLAQAVTLEDAIPNLLRIICQKMNWTVGAFWQVDPSSTHLQCTAMIDLGNHPHSSFVQNSQRMKFSKGEGLPGRIWANHHSAWI